MAQKYVGPIRRKNHGRNHSYADANGVKVPGVTTIISNGTPKKALQGWAAGKTADYVLDHWDELADMPPSERHSKLLKARYEDRDAAANRGSRVHKLAEQLAAGNTVKVDDELVGHVESYVRFLDEWHPAFELTEFVIMSHRHGYAGTGDFAAWFDPTMLLESGCADEQAGAAELLSAKAAAGEQVLAIGDTKTSRSGIFGETALQLAGYRYADVFLDADGAEQPMPAFDIALALHIRADGYDLLPIEAGPAQHRALLYVREVARFADEGRGFVGDRLDLPGRGNYRRLVVDDDAAAIGEDR